MIWFATPAISGDTGEMESGARVGVGWRVAVEVRGEFVAAEVVFWAVVLFWIGKNGSYVGRITCAGVAGAHEASRRAKRKMVEVDLFKDMGAILPVDNCKPRK